MFLLSRYHDPLQVEKERDHRDFQAQGQVHKNAGSITCRRVVPFFVPYPMAGPRHLDFAVEHFYRGKAEVQAHVFLVRD